MKLWLARHAQPLIASGMCYGVTDVAADQALTLLAAEALARVLPPQTLCRVSPLQRCQQLALALQQIRPDCLFNSSTYDDSATDLRLVEMDFGRFEGQPWAEISKAEVDAWTANFGNHRFGGNESANEVMQRVAQALQDSQAQLQALQQTQRAGQRVDDVLWITHAGVIRGATLLAQGVTQVETAEQWPREVPGFGEFTQLVF